MVLDGAAGDVLVEGSAGEAALVVSLSWSNNFQLNDLRNSVKVLTLRKHKTSAQYCPCD